MKVSAEEANQFFQLMWRLQFFVSQQHQLLPDVKSLEEYTPLAIGRKAPVRDAVWKNPDLIDAYVTKNPDGLSGEELSIISKWKGFVAGQFTIFRCLKEHAILMGGSKVYGVLGLHDAIQDVISHHPLPTLVDAVLLPFK